MPTKGQTHLGVIITLAAAVIGLVVSIVLGGIRVGYVEKDAACGVKALSMAHELEATQRGVEVWQAATTDDLTVMKTDIKKILRKMD